MNTALCLDCGLGDKDCTCNKVKMNHDLQNKIDEAEASLASQMEYINGMKDDRALSNYPSLPVHSYLWAFSEGAKFGRNDKQIQSLKDENKKFREALNECHKIAITGTNSASIKVTQIICKALTQKAEE